MLPPTGNNRNYYAANASLRASLQLQRSKNEFIHMLCGRVSDREIVYTLTSIECCMQKEYLENPVVMELSTCNWTGDKKR